MRHYSKIWYDCYYHVVDKMFNVLYYYENGFETSWIPGYGLGDLQETAAHILRPIGPTM